jgi:hypothetical protein
MLSVASAPNMLYMGDLNVSQDEIDGNTTVPEYGRYVSSGNTIFEELNPEVPIVIFSKMLSAPMSTVRQLDNQLTSLTDFYFDNSTVTIDDVGANPYDNFYYRVSTAANALPISAPSIVQMILAIAPVGTGPARSGAPNNPSYNPALAKRVMAYYKFRRGDASLQNALADTNAINNDLANQMTAAIAAAKTAAKNASSSTDSGSDTSVGKRKASTDIGLKKIVAKKAKVNNSALAIPDLAKLLSNSGLLSPLGIGDALVYYRWSVSDHIPIITTFTID